MPLIACPDCQQQVSDAAPACPRCGRPIAAPPPPPPPPQWQGPPPGWHPPPKPSHLQFQAQPDIVRGIGSFFILLPLALFLLVGAAMVLGDCAKSAKRCAPGTTC